MLIYDYRCTECEHEFEELLARDAPSPLCPKCGAPTERVISPVKLVAGSKMGPKALKLDKQLADGKAARSTKKN